MKRFGHHSEETSTALASILYTLLIVLASFFIIGKIYYFISNMRTTSSYQAVFLDNGQVYFGKLSSRRSSELVLSDVYYLQFKDESSDFNQQVDSQNPDLTLIKLGNELHGPSDVMKINRDHVMFVEELAEGSKVVSAIKDHKKK
jgi:hypothetical protein